MAKAKAEWCIATTAIGNRIVAAKMRQETAKNGKSYYVIVGEQLDVTDMVISAFLDYIEAEAIQNPNVRIGFAGRGHVQWIPEKEEE